MSPYFLEKKGAAALIISLNKTPARFKDLKKVINREGTLSRRIRELEDLKIIETEIVQDGRRKYFGYKLTNKGMSIKEKLKELETL